MRVRFCLMILAILSLALLPGPAHALPHAQRTADAAAAAVPAASVHRHDALGRHASLDHHHDGPGHHHGPACDTACCAPMCALYVPPHFVVIRVPRSASVPPPTSDLPRPDADMARALRPPESRAI